MSHSKTTPSKYIKNPPDYTQLSKYAETKLKMQALQRENVVLLSELESQQEKNARLEVQVTQCIKLLRQLLKSQERVIPVLQTFVDGPSAKSSSSSSSSSASSSDKKEAKGDGDKKKESKGDEKKESSSKKSKEEEEEAVDAGESLERAKELVLASGVKDL